jgi:hypothetical protein
LEGDERGLQRKRVEKLNGNETFGKKKVCSLLSGLLFSTEPKRKYSNVPEEDKGYISSFVE